MIFEQYSEVKLKEIKKQLSKEESLFDRREPKIGDIATIIEVYHSPHLGYELECSDENGITEWLITFSPDEVVLELIS